MGSRTKARKRALDVLFAADVRGVEATTLLAEAQGAGSADTTQPVWGYATAIVEGVTRHRIEIDELIETYAQGWSLERMPAVDRGIVRIALWEMMYNDEVPVRVAIDEAIEAAKSVSTDDSPRFVNGLLGAITAAQLPDAT